MYGLSSDDFENNGNLSVVATSTYFHYRNIHIYIKYTLQHNFVNSYSVISVVKFLSFISSIFFPLSRVFG